MCLPTPPSWLEVPHFFFFSLKMEAQAIDFETFTRFLI